MCHEVGILGIMVEMRNGRGPDLTVSEEVISDNEGN